MQKDIHYSQPLNKSKPAEKNWLKKLVDNEAEFFHTGAIDSSNQLNHNRVIEEATVEFLQELREEFTNCVNLFNAYRGGVHMPSSVKIFSISNTAADFILFRNSLKLVISNPSTGVINFAFASRTNTFSKNSTKTEREGYDLIAQMYPFNELAWTFHGEKVSMSVLVRFLFTEFVRSSVVS